MVDTPAEPHADRRLAELQRWLRSGGLPEGPLRPASSDASFRRYFRLETAAGSRIIMDAPPEREDSAPFVRVADELRRAGLHAPEILAADLERGFLVLTDLGSRTYLDVLGDANADRLYEAAVDALVTWQGATRPGTFPPYDAALLTRELRLFPDWYLVRHLGLEPDAAEQRRLDGLCQALVDHAGTQPRVWVHRDYMPRNLMVSDPLPGILDFQDAVEGPPAYDAISLVRDAFISWPRAREAQWLAAYHGRARERGLPVPASLEAFREACGWIGAQRHLKVLGIFARIRYRDGKPHYLEDAPRFLEYLRRDAEDAPALAPLVELVERWHERAGVAGE